MIFRTHTCHFHSYLLKESHKNRHIPRDKNKGLHGNCLIGPQLDHAEPKVGNLPHSHQCPENLFLDYPVIIHIQ
jgi:hypothetical protein